VPASATSQDPVSKYKKERRNEGSAEITVVHHHIYHYFDASIVPDFFFFWHSATLPAPKVLSFEKTLYPSHYLFSVIYQL
jgi:hypothetical protein